MKISFASENWEFEILRNDTKLSLFSFPSWQHSKWSEEKFEETNKKKDSERCKISRKNRRKSSSRECERIVQWRLKRFWDFLMTWWSQQHNIELKILLRTLTMLFKLFNSFLISDFHFDRSKKALHHHNMKSKCKGMRKDYDYSQHNEVCVHVYLIQNIYKKRWKVDFPLSHDDDGDEVKCRMLVEVVHKWSQHKSYWT
jgi:hypothetical protein